MSCGQEILDLSLPLSLPISVGIYIYYVQFPVIVFLFACISHLYFES